MKLKTILEGILVEQGRSKPVDKEFIRKFLLNRSRQFDPAKHSTIWRGYLGELLDYSYIEPKKHARRSKNTSNLYTLILDNSFKWSNFPNRSQSIICASSYHPARGFSLGMPHIVIPEEGANIGICSADDFWWSFKRLHEIYSAGPDKINNTLNAMSLQLFDKQVNDNSYSDMIKDFNQIDSRKEDLNWTTIQQNRMHPIAKGFSRDYVNSGKKLIHFLDELYDPTKNGFKTATFPSKITARREVWTDAPSIMLKYERGLELLDEFGYDISSLEV